MTAFHETPRAAPSFGYDFNYSVWTAGTSVTLCNVPWNSDYRDIVRFDNQGKLDEYLTAQPVPVIDIKKMSYAKPGMPITIDIPFNRAYKYNYIRAYNSAQPITGDDTPRAFYYFITDVRYVAPNTTEIQVQLDVWQTFGYDVKFGNCYIERGHVGIANENAFADYGREFLTIPEGLDIGGEYNIVDTWSHQIATARGNGNVYSVLVVSTVDLTKDPGTVDAPKLHTATGSAMSNLPNGADIYLFETAGDFRNFLAAFSEKPWVTQGIISITAIPVSDQYLVGTEAPAMVEGVAVSKVRAGELHRKKTQMKPNWRDAVSLPTRYRNLKKFRTYPYTVLEMTSYTGTPLVIKPESWNDPNGTVIEVPHFAPPGARVVFYPFRYNAAQDGEQVSEDDFGVVNDGGEFLDMATGIFNFPTFSLVNNGYMSFMASNANSISFQHQSADWSQQKALTGNQLAFDQSGAATDLSQQQNQLGINAAQQSTALANQTAGYRTVQSMANGAIGAAGGGVAGLASGAVGMANSVASLAIDTNQNNQSMGIATNLARQSNNASAQNQWYMRDSNKSYADFATKGDYQNAIGAINAKVQDAKLIQPTTAGQVGGDAFNLAAYRWGYDVKVKMLQPAAMSVIGEYWLRYGYAVQRFGRMPESFQVMTKFTYWKLRETYIQSSACPEGFKQALRGIFEKGVTVWKNPSDIGMIDMAENYPLEGVTL